MISTGTIAIPRYVESLRLYVGNFVCDTLNGVLAPFVSANSQGDIFANFAVNGVPGVPHGVVGSIRLYDGNANTIFDMPQARMQFELAAPDGPWGVIGAFVATGFDQVSQRAFGFRSVGPDPGDDRSLIVEFGVSDQASLRGASETLTWALASAK